MGRRSGVGLVELAILEALDARRARPGGKPVSCEKLLAALEGELGLARGYAYQVLIDLAQEWKLPVPLVEGRGNLGSRGSDPPASPRYTHDAVPGTGLSEVLDGLPARDKKAVPSRAARFYWIAGRQVGVKTLLAGGAVTDTATPKLPNAMRDIMTIVTFGAHWVIVASSRRIRPCSSTSRVPLIRLVPPVPDDSVPEKAYAVPVQP